MDTCNIAMPSNTLHNAYHREYYKNKVNKAVRKEQFRAYYLKNKEAISIRRKEQREAKKSAIHVTIAD